MKSLVLYDSSFGNTKRIAEVIAKELGAKVLLVSDFDPKELEGVELLILGCPIHGWRPSENMLPFLASLKPEQLKGVKAAAFDTRVKLFIHGDAASKISKSLQQAGAEIIARPQVFIVAGTKGPLLDGELEKAVIFAKSLME